MGFYIRKGLNFGPFRLNLSRSGLGASFGVTGARVGISPNRGPYIHVGRGGVYYRQTLSHLTKSSKRNPQQISPAPVENDDQEIASVSSDRMMASSADQLLQALNRIKQRKDMFPIMVVVGIIMLIRILSVGLVWWLPVLAVALVTLISVLARHYDVTGGTVLLTYSLNAESAQEFDRFHTALKQFAGCRGKWHIDATAAVNDLKRNAGAGSAERRSAVEVAFSCPKKVICNINVPTLRIIGKALFFFPDRLLFYDSRGVGAVPYGELNARAEQTRFVETGVVPSDAVQIDTTWKYVNKSGGPDRRFNDNRPLPIMTYGELYLSSRAGLNEGFQCSVPSVAAHVGELIAERQKLSLSQDKGVSVSFVSETQSNRSGHRTLLWASVVIMAGLTFFPFRDSDSHVVVQKNTQAQIVRMRQIQEEDTRQQFTRVLAQNLLARHAGVEVSSTNTKLILRSVNAGAKAERRHGLQPFDKQRILNSLLTPSTESDLCALGFRSFAIEKNKLLSNAAELDCPGPH